MTTVHDIDGMPVSAARALFESCCGASRWVERMVAHRPYESNRRLHAEADDAWDSMSQSDWLEAFSHHPRIGDKKVSAAAAGEQAGARTAAQSVQDELREVNRAYEEKFGHIYIVCATGKSAEEMLSIARQRMLNDPDAELHAAAEEQRMIMQLRIRKILGEHE